MKKEKPQWILQKYKKNIREYYELLYANKFDNLEKMDNFLETYSPPKLNQEETDQQKWNWTCNKNTPYKQKSRTRWLHGRILPNIKEEIIPTLLKFFQKVEEEGRLLKTFCDATITLIPKPDKDTTKKKIISQYLWWI